MNYELAKELKDAGFPQVYKQGNPWCDLAFDEGGELHLLHEDNDTQWYIGNDYTHSEMADEELQIVWVKQPTLDELMEECVNLNTLKKTVPRRGSMKARWVAVGTPFLYDMHTQEIKTVGDTRIEAVAKFWLEANR